MRAAIYGAFGAPPDVVLSGVDRGPNTGRSMLHSGTVGAAMTAAIHGRPALALSAVMGSPGWSTAAWVAPQAIEWALRAPDSTLLNVNVPGCPVEEMRGIRVTELASVGSVNACVSEAGQGPVRVTFSDEMEEPEAASDVRGLASGFVSVTAIRPLGEDPGVDVAAVMPLT